VGGAHPGPSSPIFQPPSRHSRSITGDCSKRLEVFAVSFVVAHVSSGRIRCHSTQTSGLCPCPIPMTPTVWLTFAVPSPGETIRERLPDGSGTCSIECQTSPALSSSASPIPTKLGRQPLPTSAVPFISEPSPTVGAGASCISYPSARRRRKARWALIRLGRTTGKVSRDRPSSRRSAG